MREKLVKVITALEHCREMSCNTCPYMDNGKGGWDCRTMQEDALEILKGLWEDVKDDA